MKSFCIIDAKLKEAKLEKERLEKSKDTYGVDTTTERVKYSKRCS